MLRRFIRCALLAALVFALPSAASATSITSNLTADDTFSLYLSVSDSVAGTLVCSDPDNFWGTATSCGPTSLTPGVTNYLHVVATDLFGAPSMFIGSFTLSDNLFQFSNGTQSLTTNNTDWVVRTSGFADPNGTPVDIGTNGVAPWGFFPSIAPGAEAIWDTPGGCNFCTRYFSTAITPTQATPAPVPEPGTFTMLGLGLAASLRRLRARLR